MCHSMLTGSNSYHLVPCQVPQPHEPDASVAKSLAGAERVLTRMTPHSTPIQRDSTMLHVCLLESLYLSGLDEASGDGCIGTACRRSIILLRNAQPDRTTLHAWLRSPIRDSNSRREHALRSPQVERSAWRRCILSAGSRSVPAIVSTSMPRYVNCAVGPSLLCSAVGTPKVAQTPSRIAIPCAHWGESGAPSSRKSSK